MTADERQGKQINLQLADAKLTNYLVRFDFSTQAGFSHSWLRLTFLEGADLSALLSWAP